MKNKGKLIVIDGTDGSGKATQTTMLVAQLRRTGYPVSTFDFPQYGKKSAALVEEYLNGKFGTARDVTPEQSSIFFAVDRYAARKRILEALNQGRIIIANRYVTANMGHQGAKIKNQHARRRFFRWLDDLEYRIFGIPRPDVTIILYTPARISQMLVGKKGHRAYIGKKKLDIHEANRSYLASTGRAYLDIARMFPNITLIRCVARSRLLTPKEVHEKIWDIATPLVSSRVRRGIYE